ncbi:uncharacterized protein LOC130670915 [Microplitis mediator]|uniref:uncharacterized protein LOC130670915 n=1 Tax=Microplitis mediator TaxID=375433 RepID=UPI00255258FD|nr:uncharacterized protein LOC130670915 [Microplitis mediator]
MMAKINNYTCPMAVAMAGWFVLIIFINTVYADDLSSSLTASGIPTTTETSSHSNAFLDSVEKDDSNLNDKTQTTSSPIVLQPNITGALDVGQGLLVPLVPVVDPTANKTSASPLVASLLPVAVESVPPTDQSDESKDGSDSSSAEIKDDMDVAEDIIFRPLFRYRQEVAARQSKSYNQRYYQPYIYAYRKRPNYYNYDDAD